MGRRRHVSGGKFPGQPADGLNGMAVTGMCCGLTSKESGGNPGVRHGVSAVPAICTADMGMTIPVIMQGIIPASISLPAMTVFTLYDLYAYNNKHNEANGWNNLDGHSDNRSWNCGAEGETSDPEVLKLRFRMIRNACAVLMCSRGTPMFLAGDEFGNTQYGNNNGYCQDNEISWLNWNDLEKNRGLFEFFKYMIAFRQEHRVIREKLPDAVCGMDPIHTHDTDAERTDIARDAMTFCVSFAGYDLDKGKDDLVYIAVNTYWEDVRITLPKVYGRVAWYMNVNTWGNGEGKYTWSEEEAPFIQHDLFMKPRSVVVFTGRV